MNFDFLFFVVGNGLIEEKIKCDIFRKEIWKFYEVGI